MTPAPSRRAGTRCPSTTCWPGSMWDVKACRALRRRKRLEVHGPNELQSLGRQSAWRTFVAQFQNVLILILLSATVVSGFLGHTLEATVITVIVLFAVLLGFIQEYRAGRALDALRRDGGARRARASRRRGGRRPGARAGSRRCRAAARRRSRSRRHAADAGDQPHHRRSRAHRRIGAGAEVGRAARRSRAAARRPTEPELRGNARRVRPRAGPGGRHRHVDRVRAASPAWWRSVEVARTPLQENLDRLGAALGKAALAVVALVVVIGLVRGLPVIEMFMFGIALAVAVVPEALPAVVTISLAIGVRRMVKRNALVRRLPIVETLGSTSVICSDKTGTLTRNEMTVRQLFVATRRLLEVTGAGYDAGRRIPRRRPRDRPTRQRAPAAGRRGARVGCAAGQPRRPIARGGRPHRRGARRGGDQSRPRSGRASATQQPRIAEIPFTSERRRMTTVHQAPDGVIVAYSKGATEDILAGCTHAATGRPRRTADPVGSRTDPRRRAADGWRRPPRAGHREQEPARRPKTPESDMTLLGPRRDDGPAAARSARGRAHERSRRHPRRDDHRRSSADRQHRRPRDRLARRPSRRLRS